MPVNNGLDGKKRAELGATSDRRKPFYGHATWMGDWSGTQGKAYRGATGMVED